MTQLALVTACIGSASSALPLMTMQTNANQCKPRERVCLGAVQRIVTLSLQDLLTTASQRALPLAAAAPAKLAAAAPAKLAATVV
eukprot:12798-Heterococcus_DN1.PRE.3